MRRSIQLALLLVLLIAMPLWVNGQAMSAQEEAALRAELQKLEEEIARQEKVLNIQRSQSASIERDVSVLRAEIDKARSIIRQQDLQIQRLGKEINEKTETINLLNEDIEKRKQSLARLIQLTQEIDQTGFISILLGSQTVSEFYADVDSFAALKESIKESVDKIRGVQEVTEEQKQTLQQKQNEELDAKKEAERQKNLVERNEAEKQRLLNISKNKEKEYEEIIAERKAKAAEIRAALFRLRDAGPIPFGDAYEYAKVASQSTGVRPALILAILKQESNLGANVGTCYLADPKTGDGVRINSGTAISRVMKPSRDVEPFLRITKKLGRDPYATRVSCPWTIGYGGAMGPSQFIPSTWEIFENRIASIMGTTADPWNPRHAITATALYLKDLGAAAASWTAEREAACRYYSGVSCYHPTIQNMFYGNSVMGIAEEIQANIDILESV